jgi:hypothetical protein
MDEAADDAALVFANGQPYELFEPPQPPVKIIHKIGANVVPSTILPFLKRRDKLGTTHHEAGTLRFGTTANDSVTNEDCRFHHVANTYVVGPALFPTIGSPNPMLTGTALAQRLGDHFARPAPQADPGFTLLFDGMSPSSWQMSTISNQPGRDNPGRFHAVDGGLESAPGTDLGLFYTKVPFDNYILKLEWLTWREDDNSGIFLRFPDVKSKGYDNTAFVAVDFGFEVQIDALGRGDPPPGQNVDPKFRTTGAIYNTPTQTLDESVVANGPGQWNEFEIQVKDHRFTVFLNGQQKGLQPRTTDSGLPVRWLANAHRARPVPQDSDQGQPIVLRGQSGAQAEGSFYDADPPPDDGISSGDLRRPRHGSRRLGESVGECRDSDRGTPLRGLRRGSLR